MTNSMTNEALSSMTNEALTRIVLDHEKRIKEMEGARNLPVEPEPVHPEPVDQPKNYTDIDMNRAYHIDFHLLQDETKVFRFKFSNTSRQCYAHFTAVQLGSGGCLELAIPAYGYIQDDCRVETSEGVATDGRHTDWVVKQGEYIYLHVINYADPVTVRLKSNGENLY